MVSNKGQMSAPFELMVAMIIMGFVIVVGYNLMASMQCNICQNDLDKAVTVFKSGLEKAVNNSTVEKFSFKYDGCFKESLASARIVKYVDNLKACERACGEARSTCFVLIFNASDSSCSPYVSKCLNIPDLTSFVSESTECEKDESLQDYGVVSTLVSTDLKKNNLLMGQYVIKTVSSSSSFTPKICVYYKR
ncbi:MAG: hypothetical protein PHQ98_02575 [Candidatus ainarchaeum sp.]|nr:hypothetical protein [Candidatus ainarchaeum sp.]